MVCVRVCGDGLCVCVCEDGLCARENGICVCMCVWMCESMNGFKKTHERNYSKNK